MLRVGDPHGTASRDPTLPNPQGPAGRPSTGVTKRRCTVRTRGAGNFTQHQWQAAWEIT